MVEMNYLNLVGLNSHELASILKSNVLPWKIRRSIRILGAHEFIKEMAPIIATVAITAAIMEIIKGNEDGQEK